MSDKIRIIGLMVNARHGDRHEERTLTQPFEIDVEIERDLSLAGVTDKLDDTVDYGRVVDIVKTVMNGDHCRLLESLAERILDRMAELIRADVITVRIRKPRAPIDIPFDTIEVEMSRKLSK